MQRYPVSRDCQKELNLSALRGKIEEVFGGQATEDGSFLVATFGALKQMKVGVDGKSLLVETLMEPKVPPETQAETIRRYNRFLEVATGYSSKERAKRMQKELKGN
jgi:hypothetical protein